MVPVRDPLKQKAVLLQEGFSSDEIKGGYKSLNFIDGALQSEADRSILKRCKSRREQLLTTLRSGKTQRLRWLLENYMTSSTTIPFPPTATPSRHCIP